jgi:hypothetical protein
VSRSKHVEQLRNIGIINSTTRLHLVGYLYMIYIMMHESMIIKLPYVTFKISYILQQPIFLFTSVRSLYFFYLLLSLLSAIRFSNQCHTFVKRKFFHHHACELFVTFDRHVLTAVRNFIAESIHCRRISCRYTHRQCH